MIYHIIYHNYTIYGQLEYTIFMYAIILYIVSYLVLYCIVYGMLYIIEYIIAQCVMQSLINLSIIHIVLHYIISYDVTIYIVCQSIVSHSCVILCSMVWRPVQHSIH